MRLIIKWYVTSSKNSSSISAINRKQSLVSRKKWKKWRNMILTHKCLEFWMYFTNVSKTCVSTCFSHSHLKAWEIRYFQKVSELCFFYLKNIYKLLLLNLNNLSFSISCESILKNSDLNSEVYFISCNFFLKIFDEND